MTLPWLASTWNPRRMYQICTWPHPPMLARGPDDAMFGFRCARPQPGVAHSGGLWTLDKTNHGSRGLGIRDSATSYRGRAFRISGSKCRNATTLKGQCPFKMPLFATRQIRISALFGPSGRHSDHSDQLAQGKIRRCLHLYLCILLLL